MVNRTGQQFQGAPNKRLMCFLVANEIRFTVVSRMVEPDKNLFSKPFHVFKKFTVIQSIPDMISECQSFYILFQSYTTHVLSHYIIFSLHIHAYIV